MPKIPSYQEQVGIGAQPTVRANENQSIEDFGGGQALENASATVQGLVKQQSEVLGAQKKSADDAWGMNLYAQAVKKKNDLIYNEQTGAMTKKGLDALPVVEQYGGAFNTYMDELTNSATNADQRAQAQQIRAKLGVDLNDTLQKHTFSESQSFQDQVAKDAIEATGEDVKLNFQDPEKLSSGIKLQESVARQSLARKGITGPDADFQVHKITSGTYLGVVDRMSSVDPAGAKALYDDFVKSGFFTSDDLKAAGKTIETVDVSDQAQKITDSLLTKHPTLTSALADIDENYKENVKVRDEAKRRTKQAFSDQQAAQEADDRNRFNAASDILKKSGSVDDIPKAQWAGMSTKQQIELYEQQKQIRSGQEPAANGEKFMDLMTMGTTPALRDKFLKTNLAEYKSQLTTQEFTKLLDRQGALRDGTGEDKLSTGFRQTSEIVDATLGEFGYDKDKVAKNQFRAYVDQQVETWKQVHGKDPSSQEVQGIVDRGFQKFTDPNSGLFGMFQSSKRMYQVQTGDTLDMGIEDVPPREKQNIEAAFQQRFHRAPTDQETLHWYGQALSAQRKNGR